MTEERVGFLYNIASNLPQENKSLKILRSYYLMRCNQLTKGYGLPRQHFSSKVRCSHCCLEWRNDSEVKTQPIKLSKKQRLRIRTLKSNEQNKNKVAKSKALLKSNEMIQTCGFCNKVTTTKLIKPEKAYIKMVSSNKKDFKGLKNVKGNNKKKPELNKSQKSENKKAQPVNTKSKLKQNATTVNVYSNTFDVFSLKNEKNTLLSTIKEPVKVIKNNKKKKDKFAGLCEKAVLASAKLKHQNEKKLQEQHSTSKLSLFLKPSV